MSARYSVREGILDRAIGDELLVHRFDTDEVFVLNGDARLVFTALKQSPSVDEALDFVCARVFGDALELQQAVMTTIDRLAAEGLIVPEGEE
jgi:hypothetical protein